MPGNERLQARLVVHGDEGGVRLDLAVELFDGITALMGPSGAGKTTFLLACAGLVRPSEGHLALDGRVLFDAWRRVWVPPHRRRVALVFQSLALFPHLKTWENVAYGLPERSRASRREHAHRWLERARVGHVADRLPATLSGGEAQRVALARALAAEPHLLLLDEPFSALDAELRGELGDALQELVSTTRTPTVLVTHDAKDAARISRRVLHLAAGRLVRDEVSSD